MSSIISEQNLEKIENMRKYVLKAAIWMLIGGVVFGAIMILVGGTSAYDTIGKFVGTMLILAVMLVVSVNNFKMIAFRNATVQSFALLGLGTNIFWAIFWILLCWNPEWGVTCSASVGYRGGFEICKQSMLFKVATLFSYWSALGLIGSNVMYIYEGGRKGLVRPLKLTSVVLAAYEVLYLTIMIFCDYDFRSEVSARFGMLAVFVAVAWFAVTIAAAIVSSNEKSRHKAEVRRAEEARRQSAQPVPQALQLEKPVVKTDAELRAEIEEQVRREMIEKEVRARLEAEKAKESGENKSDSGQIE